jgi:hypothetical protein
MAVALLPDPKAAPDGHHAACVEAIVEIRGFAIS